MTHQVDLAESPTTTNTWWDASCSSSTRGPHETCSHMESMCQVNNHKVCSSLRINSLATISHTYIHTYSRLPFHRPIQPWVRPGSRQALVGLRTVYALLERLSISRTNALPDGQLTAPKNGRHFGSLSSRSNLIAKQN